MKKIVLTLSLTFITAFSYAQTAFETAMQEKIDKIETCKSADDFQALSNDFNRIGRIDNSWLTYYYAAFSQIQKGRLLMRENKTDELDNVADVAEKYLNVANDKNPDNAEVYILYKMIHGLRMMVNPMQRYMTEGKKASEALAKAEELDPNNPRITVLKAEDLYFTPEQFGGSKAKGIELFKKALTQFESYKTASAIAPNWGKGEAEYFISLEK